jgi:hypothetical protein
MPKRGWLRDQQRKVTRVRKVRPQAWGGEQEKEVTRKDCGTKWKGNRRLRFAGNKGGAVFTVECGKEL